MLIVTGMKPNDIERAVVWTTDRGDIIVQPGWPLVEAITVTFQNLVKISTDPTPEIEATNKITEALETGVRLMRMAFAPSANQIEEIKLKLGVEKNSINSDQH